jgi:MGT family glycosyltransferase
MARFLFVVPPLTGHVNPTVSVARELDSRGHEVAWVGHPHNVRPLLPAKARLFELDERIGADRYEQVLVRASETRGLPAFKLLWEDFLVPLARNMIDGVDKFVTQFDPSVLVVDQQAIAGALVARRQGRRWATFATTSAGVVDPLESLPKVREWMFDQLRALQEEAGLPVVERPENSPYLVVVFSTEALTGAGAGDPAVAWVGPSIHQRPETVTFPFETLRPGPRVLISLGTVNARSGERFYQVAIDALRDQAVQVILVAPEELVRAAPENFIVQKFIPQLAVLPHVNAVVCHAGHNTVCEALSLGLPLVVAPIKDDQPVVAQQVVDAGAGIRVKYGRVTAPQLRDAVRRVLEEPAFHEAATRIRASFEAAGGARAAADRLERLVV